MPPRRRRSLSQRAPHSLSTHPADPLLVFPNGAEIRRARPSRAASPNVRGLPPPNSGAHIQKEARLRWPQGICGLYTSGPYRLDASSSHGDGARHARRPRRSTDTPGPSGRIERATTARPTAHLEPLPGLGLQSGLGPLSVLGALSGRQPTWVRSASVQYAFPGHTDGVDEESNRDRPDCC